jgi:hypothetical protein
VEESARREKTYKSGEVRCYMRRGRTASDWPSNRMNGRGGWRVHLLHDEGERIAGIYMSVCVLKRGPGLVDVSKHNIWTSLAVRHSFCIHFAKSSQSLSSHSRDETVDQPQFQMLGIKRKRVYGC